MGKGKRSRALRELKEKYGVKDLPRGIIESNSRLRMVSLDALRFSKQMRGLRSIGVALTGEAPDILTIEGAQILAKSITRGAVELQNREEEEKLVRGEPVSCGTGEEELVVVGYKGDWLGSGRLKKGSLKLELPNWRVIKTHVNESGSD
ncbi:MAG: hypothetical protein JXB14_08245 [Candidatus Altiarchaeota archaeon]|nr:hypothetical protein [Candidatus Altiarchaeota archaeon]